MLQRVIGLILLLILTTSLAGHAQNSPGLKTVVAPSPNASALGKYGEIPVGMYTGIPNINIPLYTLKGRELEVPIGLNYHAGGVRVEEIASLVGIGWSLNAGGVITRAIRGAPDDAGGGYFSSYAARTAMAKEYMTTGSLASLQVGLGNAAEADVDAIQSIKQSVIDGEPDIYYFNFGKYSGSFFMNEQGQLVVSPLQALKIQYSFNQSNTIGQWILTTPDGTRYVFGTSLDGSRVATESNSNGAPWPVATTGWYLEDIYSSHNDTISFAYTNISYSYISRSSEVLNWGINGNNGQFPFKDNKIGTNNMIVPRLTSITSANGTINFIAGANRVDLPGEAPLAQINIYNKLGSGTFLKNWQFYYDYSTNRLTLDSLREYSSDGTLQGQGYKFAYNGSLPNPDPNGTALNSQDLWGYYNGVLNSVLPQGYTTTTPYGTATISGADRHSDGTAMQFGTLTQITYPTGGYSHFDFEANTVYQAAGDNSIPPAPIGKDGLVIFSPVQTVSDTFTITYPDPNTNVAVLTGEIHTMNTGCTFDNNGFSQCYTAWLVGINGTSYGPQYFKEGSISATLPAGTYVMVGQGSGDQTQSGNIIHFELDWTEYPPLSQSPLQPVNKTIGGLRIKRITNFDGVSTSITKYLYNNFSDTGSSGVLVNEPYNYVNLFESTAANQPTVYYLQVKSFPLIPLMPTQGAAIGYQHVTKMEGENGENGKEEYTYTTANDFPDQVQDYRPYPPSCAFDWRRGQLLKTATYKNNSGSFVPIQVKSNGYVNSIKQSTSYGITVDCDLTQTGNILVPPTNYYVAGYRTISEFQYLQADTTLLYDQNNLAAYQQTINNYAYDTVQGHYQLTKSVTTDSKNHTEETDYSYPQDVTLSGYEETARQNLISNFILTPVLDTKVLRNGTQIRDTKNNYKVFSNGYPLPESVDMQIAQYPIERRIEFLRYDNFGNLTQQHKMNDELNTYIWNYNQSYPIATAINADSADIAYTSFEADGTGNWILANGTIDPTVCITGRSSFQLNGGTISKFGLNSSTTYIVSYWSQNGSYSIPGTISGYPTTGKSVSFNNPGWTLYVHKVTGQSTITVGGTGHIDELRLYPATAQMTTYTYDPFVGMTSQADAGNRITYYEYDGLQRLKRIRDQDYNILKTFEYQYQASSGCGGNCFSIPMQTLAGTPTLSYPVGVFNIHGKLLGNAATPVAYTNLWNSDTADTRLGSLVVGADSMHFKITLNAGQTLPASVTGCRYYQVDLSWNVLDGVRNINAAYVDFGDGIGMRLGRSPLDTTNLTLAPSTVLHYNTGTAISDGNFYIQYGPYYIHTYHDTSLKRITFYHNDSTETPAFDSWNYSMGSLSRITNFQGNFPQHMTFLGGTSYQQSGASSVANVKNWNTIRSITTWYPYGGYYAQFLDPWRHMSYAQDFMAADTNLATIRTANGSYYTQGFSDTTFKLSRMKTNWTTYFTKLSALAICEDQWNHEDLSVIPNLVYFNLIASNVNHSNTSSGNSLVYIAPSEIDTIFNQIDAGSGQHISGGTIIIQSGGTWHTSASSVAVAHLLSRGWTLTINSTAVTN